MIYTTIDKSAEALHKQIKNYSWYSHIAVGNNTIFVYTKDLVPASFRYLTQYDDWQLKFVKLAKLRVV